MVCIYLIELLHCVLLVQIQPQLAHASRVQAQRPMTLAIDPKQNI